MNDEMELLPAIQPLSWLDRWREESLYLDFVSGEPLDERLTTVRGTEAARWNEDGVLEFVPPNTPRQDFDPVTGECRGLLVEEARTNLLPNSEHLGTASWSVVNAKLIPANAVAPDGTLSACTLVEDTSTLAHNIWRGTSALNLQDNTAYTLSFYAKAAGRSYAYAETRTKVPSWPGCFFELIGAGSASTPDGRIQHVGNGWYRCSLLANPLSGSAGTNMLVCSALSMTERTYAGDGESGIHLWGLQLEQGAFPTSYIRTIPQFQSRASTATYFDAQGILRTALANEPRYGHGYADGRWIPTGLLLEGQATNLFKQSSNFADPAWLKTAATIARRSVVGPDGADECDAIIATTQADIQHYTHQLVSVTAGTKYCFSVFVKPALAKRVELLIHDGGGDIPQGLGFDLTAGTIVDRTIGGTAMLPANQGSITLCANGWYRISVWHTADATSATGYGRLYIHNGQSVTFAGDGVSDYLYLSRAQFEEGTAPTSHISTAAAAVTRAADVAPSSAVTRAADVVGIATAGWYREDEGAWLAEFNAQVPRVSNSSVVSMETAGQNAGLYFGRNANASASFVQQAEDMSAVSSASLGWDATKAYQRMAVAAGGQSGTQLALNGALKQAWPNARLTASFETMAIGCRRGSNQLNGHVRYIAYYPRRLPNEQLQRLSTL